MIDLTETNAADRMFVEITSMEPSESRSTMIDSFYKTFGQQLSKEYRDAYLSMKRFNMQDDISESEWLAGEAAYNYGMARQEASLMDF